MIQKKRDFCPKMAFTATNITLLPPLLPPLNVLYHRVLGGIGGSSGSKIHKIHSIERWVSI